MAGAMASGMCEAARIPVACFCGQHETCRFAVHAGKWRLSLLLKNSLTAFARVVSYILLCINLQFFVYKPLFHCLIVLFNFIVW